MASIQRYESGMAVVRDAVWWLAIWAGVVGWIPFANALVFGGLAWFGMALLRRAPRLLGRYWPFVTHRWREINRVLLFQVVVTTVLGEMVRTDRITEPAASLFFILSLVASGWIVVRQWRRFNRTQYREAV